MAALLKIALVQTPLIWEDPSANRALFGKKITEIDEDVDLIVLPEMFTTGFTMKPERISKEENTNTLAWMRKEAARKQAALAGSIIAYQKESYYNRLYFVHPNGDTLFYDKRHTFTLAGEHKAYQAGTKRLIVEFRGFRIAPFICYDLRFPVWCRNVDPYDLALFVANWPKPRIAAWDALLQARAIENMAYSVGVNRIGVDATGHEYNGHSAVYDCLGGRLGFSVAEEVVMVTLRRDHIDTTRAKLRFLQDRDQFTIESA